MLLPDVAGLNRFLNHPDILPLVTRRSDLINRVFNLTALSRSCINCSTADARRRHHATNGSYRMHCGSARAVADGADGSPEP
jgi:hypothetical protein